MKTGFPSCASTDKVVQLRKKSVRHKHGPRLDSGLTNTERLAMEFEYYHRELIKALSACQLDEAQDADDVLQFIYERLRDIAADVSCIVSADPRDLKLKAKLLLVLYEDDPDEEIAVLIRSLCEALLQS